MVTITKWQQPASVLTANSILDLDTEPDESSFSPSTAVLLLLNFSQSHLKWKNQMTAMRHISNQNGRLQGLQEAGSIKLGLLVSASCQCMRRFHLPRDRLTLTSLLLQS